ncbi:GTP 3',8-cyclase MoaA [Rubritalea profundi]|uniref:GTP 3',8-cyclase n=1 Tax=Rubritalea profundi TaxID=1658618 RepID=A0A2S7U5P5_9BACT|nr:GTP 3',8-cyclase MoaA [Rubritalea profundi]PQJ29503.1 cyclic pyranopterin phosphate synthase [Rubritalea profundi]
MSSTDTLQRPLRDLRISVTDRCNFRCRYCMPAEIFDKNYSFLPREEILRFGEIETLARSFVSLGVRKLRLTGGEPLMRRDLDVLVGKLAAIEGVDDIAMTTNGSLLARNAQKLADAGLHRVTVSLDSLDNAIFGKMNGVGAKADRVIEGIDAALAAGLGVKLNAVVQKGINESELLPLAQFAYERNISIRYIEFMDTGNTNGWKHEEVVPSQKVLELLQESFPLVSVADAAIGETARRYHIEGRAGFEVGFISSVTKPFCRDCNRIRLSADGHLYTCLFAQSGYDIKSSLREGETPEQLMSRISSLWGVRDDRYSELRSEGMAPVAKKEMSYLGG